MSRSFTKEAIIDGAPARIRCLEIGDQIYAVSSGAVRVMRLEDEWYEDVADPANVIGRLSQCQLNVDIFTFWQRLLDSRPRFNYRTEVEALAALPIKTFDHWWEKQIRSSTRNHIRNAEKKGVETRTAVYDDDFIRGMTEIFNETAIRQGRPFWHYGKDFETVKEQFSRYLFREDLIAAYYRNEMIGFAMVANAGKYAVLGQFISKMRHRDKSTNNALIAKAVAVCAEKELPYLVYGHWDGASLGTFKRENGFEKVPVPRYYVPVTRLGSIALHLGLHRRWRDRLPSSLRSRLKRMRVSYLRLRATPER